MLFDRPLAFEALDHQWLRVVAPATPLEAWQCGDPEPMDNALFDEMREMDNQLEKVAVYPPQPYSVGMDSGLKVDRPLRGQGLT